MASLSEPINSISWNSFRKHFDSVFWKHFSKMGLMEVPKDSQNRESLLRSVFASIESDSYFPSDPELFLYKDKGFGVARSIPVFGIKDYIVYFFCVKELESIICINRVSNTFGGWRLGGGLRKRENQEIEEESSDYGRYSINPAAWSQAFNDFNALLYAQIDEDGADYVVELDIANFYDNIRLDILEDKIRQHDNGFYSPVIKLLFKFLNNWDFKRTGGNLKTVGLPQDALGDCSRILANYYLQDYDNFANSLLMWHADAFYCGVYFRYADDQVLVMRKKEGISKIVLLLSQNLSKIGLSINQRKVKITTEKEFQVYRNRDLFAILKDNEVIKDSQIVENYVNEYLKISSARLMKGWNSSYPILNRLLSCNLRGLSDENKKTIFRRLIKKEYLYSLSSYKIKKVYNFSTMLNQKNLLIKRLRELIKSGYHNDFHYQVLSFAREINDDSLEKSVLSRINELKQFYKGKYDL